MKTLLLLVIMAFVAVLVMRDDKRVADMLNPKAMAAADTKKTEPGPSSQRTEQRTAPSAVENTNTWPNSSTPVFTIERFVDGGAFGRLSNGATVFISNFKTLGVTLGTRHYVDIRPAGQWTNRTSKTLGRGTVDDRRSQQSALDAHRYSLIRSAKAP